MGLIFNGAPTTRLLTMGVGTNTSTATLPVSRLTTHFVAYLPEYPFSLLIEGSGGIAITVPTLDGTGTETISGSGGAAVTALSIAATGTETISGTGAETVSVGSDSGTGTEEIDASGGVTISAPTLSGSGTVTIPSTTPIHGAGPAFVFKKKPKHITLDDIHVVMSAPLLTLAFYELHEKPHRKLRTSLHLSTRLEASVSFELFETCYHMNLGELAAGRHVAPKCELDFTHSRALAESEDILALLN